jgi:hypothetical protein
LKRGFVEAACSGLRDEPFQVKLMVDRIGSALVWVKLRPDLGQPVVVGSPALRAGSMAGRERGGVIEEEQLGVAAGAP